MTFGRGDMRKFRPVCPLRSKFSSLEDGGTGKFPADYMFMLTEDELSDLRSRFLTANARAANPSRRFNHEIHEIHERWRRESGAIAVTCCSM